MLWRKRTHFWRTRIFPNTAKGSFIIQSAMKPTHHDKLCSLKHVLVVDK